METPKIEKGIPIPAISQHRQNFCELMEVGDSFATDKNGAASAMSYFRKAGKRGVSRRLADGSFRVWRQE